MPGDDDDAPSNDEDLATRAREAMVRARSARRHSRQAALDVLGGNESANQPQPWTPAGFGLIRDQQIAVLENFADREGLWIDFPSLGKRHSGRMEHAVFRPVPFEGTAFKATKGTKFGFYPYCPRNVVSSSAEDLFEMRPATPAQYLARLEVWDEFAFGITRFEGFTRLDGNFSIVTSQTWYEARNATWLEISDFLRELGFLPVRSGFCDDPTRWYHPGQDLALFDVGQSNILWSDGMLFPIDVVPVHPDDFMRAQLRSVLRLGD